jgi:hypothetical protein
MAGLPLQSLTDINNIVQTVENIKYFYLIGQYFKIRMWKLSPGDKLYVHFQHKRH